MARYSESSIPSTSSAIEDSETDNVFASLFSKVSLALAGHSWELNDLLNKVDNVGSDCLDTEGAPAKAAG